MTLQEFQAKLTPIITRWPRAYSGDQLSLVYDVVKTLSVPDFERLVRHLLGSSRYAPMVPDFQKGISELSLRTKPVLATVTESISVPVVEDHTYKIRDNIWANNDYIFVRGKTIRENIFIFKSENPNHPLALEDKKVRTERINEIKSHIAKNTYSQFMSEATQAYLPNFKHLNFDSMEGA